MAIMRNGRRGETGPAIETDVLVVGSGFGAAAPALRLAEAGARVIVVEKGPHLDPDRDFRQTQDPGYLLRYLRGISGDHLSMGYVTALGGGSGFYEMISLRAPSVAFRQTDDSGQSLWPSGLDRRALDPWYEVAEEMLRVQQIPPDRVPRTGLVFSLMMKRLGHSCDRGRYAVRDCVGSGFCVTGCLYGAKQSLHLNYIPRMLDAGARIETELEAREVRFLGDARPSPGVGRLRTAPYRWEVRCRRGTDEREPGGEPVMFRSRLLVLAGGTVGTATLLLRSARRLPGLGPQVGRNVAFNGSVKTAGLLSEDLPDGDMYTGQSHPGVFSWEFLESHGVVVSPAKPLPLQAVSSARLRLEGDERVPAHWGRAHVELMKAFRHRGMVLTAHGLTPPAGRIELEKNRPSVRLDPTPELAAYKDRTEGLLRSLLLRSGCRLMDPEFVRVPEGTPLPDLFFATSHQVGSCRMADGPERGVVDASGESFAYPGLYITDGAAIPSSLAVSPSLTILANAERIAAGMVKRHGLARRRAARIIEPLAAPLDRGGARALS